jgi:hypothetical protein
LYLSGKNSVAFLAVLQEEAELTNAEIAALKGFPEPGAC